MAPVEVVVQPTDVAPAEPTKGEVDAVQLQLSEVALPPAPPPLFGVLRAERVRGVAVVLLFFGGQMGLAHCLLQLMLKPPAWFSVFVAIVDAGALAALACFLGISLADPGVVHRGALTCSPLPAEVEERLRRGAPLTDLQNLTEEGRSFCVRCCVWRDPQHVRRRGRLWEAASACLAHDECMRAQGHHCSKCGKCVLFFDHHCGVLGHCIAGRGLHGNVKWYFPFVALVFASALSTLATTVGGTIVLAKQ